MFSLLKSDVYRLVHGKMLWVLLAVFVAVLGLEAAVVGYAAEHWASAEVSITVGAGGNAAGAPVADEGAAANAGGEGGGGTATDAASSATAGTATMADAAADAAALEAEMASDAADLVEGNEVDLASKQVISLTALWGQAFVSGGAVTLFVGILMALFLASDFETHFVRNLVMDRVGRRRYYGEKLVLGALVALLFLLVGMALTPAFFALAGLSVASADGAAGVVLWALIAWLTMTVYAWLVSVVVWTTRKVAAGVVAAVLVAGCIVGGVALTVVSYIGGGFPLLAEAACWVPFHNIMMLASGSGMLEAPYGSTLTLGDGTPLTIGSLPGLMGGVQSVMVAVLWLALCAVATFVLLRKRDV